MGQQTELVPLVCSKCNSPVPAEPDEVAWVCSQCGQGLLLDETRGLSPMEVNFVQGLSPNQPGRPFWVVNGTVTGLTRSTYKGNELPAAQAFWSQTRRFFIPAYDCRLEELLQLGTQMLAQPPALQSGPQARFAPVTLHTEDLPAAAEFVVMAIEASRKDQLRDCKFQLNLSQPVLWVLP